MAECTYWVSYPSGGQLIARGRLVIIRDHHWIAAIPDDEAAPITVIDPRAVIRQEGRVVYSPRAHMRCAPAWVRRWLNQHPNWARVAA